jgi:hypothetical protein
MAPQDTTASPREGIGFGAAVGITLYGIVVVLFSLADHEGTVLPERRWLIAVIMIAAALVGAVLGAGFGRSRK